MRIVLTSTAHCECTPVQGGHAWRPPALASSSVHTCAVSKKLVVGPHEGHEHRGLTRAFSVDFRADEMSEDAEAGEGFSDGDDDALLHVAHHDDDLAGIEDVDIGDDEDEDGEAHEDDEDDDEEEDGAGDLGEDGAEELVDEEDDVEGALLGWVHHADIACFYG